MSGNVSILMLGHNKAEYTRRTLDALLQSTLRPFQLVLVNNGSTDHTAAVFDSFRQRAGGQSLHVDVLNLPDVHSAITGRNRGMALLKGEYWAFLDNDVCVCSRSWLERLRAVLESDPKIGVVGPKLVYPHPPHDIQCAGCAVTPAGQVIFCGRGEPRANPAWNARRECQTLISACWMMPAHVAREAGELDEQFSPVQFEDIDYCYRIRDLGYRCVYEPAVEMYHFENVTTGGTGTLNYPYLTVKNGLKFKTKWKHRFECEGGPLAWEWANIATVKIEDVPEHLELLP